MDKQKKNQKINQKNDQSEEKIYGNLRLRIQSDMNRIRRALNQQWFSANQKTV